jgi:hypothetical protein
VDRNEREQARALTAADEQLLVIELLEVTVDRASGRADGGEAVDP